MNDSPTHPKVTDQSSFFDDFARRILLVPKEEYYADVSKEKQAKHKPKWFKAVPAKRRPRDKPGGLVQFR